MTKIDGGIVFVGFPARPCKTSANGRQLEAVITLPVYRYHDGGALNIYITAELDDNKTEVIKSISDGGATLTAIADNYGAQLLSKSIQIHNIALANNVRIKSSALTIQLNAQCSGDNPDVISKAFFDMAICAQQINALFEEVANNDIQR